MKTTPQELSITLTHADQEKRSAALSSIVAAVFLTSMKIVVGLLTGSLGILAEAAHSALDLVAAAVTFFAVRVSGRPADREHTYGHGKIENLSALFETVLLLVTCAWIIYEAIQRLFFHEVAVDAGFWSFLVMATSIGIDYSRSRILMRAAKKYNSQALEADALHFSTDIWSSTVVIGGLVFVWLADVLQVSWLTKADAVAALGVSAIVIYVSVELGKKTITALLDGVPATLREDVLRVARVPGVVEVRQARVRQSGPEVFADVILTVKRNTAFEQTHEIASQAETAVRQALGAPGADVIVHVEPTAVQGEDRLDIVRQVAARHNLSAHALRIYDLPGLRSLELHLEFDEALNVSTAHTQATAFEEALYAELPGIDRIVTHLEPGGKATTTRAASLADEAHVLQVLKEVGQAVGISCEPHDVVIGATSEDLSLSFHCTLNGRANLAEAHHLTEQFEHDLRVRLPNLGRVMIHIEPPEREA